MAARCAVCGAAAGWKCARCCLVRYCGKEHQSQDWPRHKLDCREATPAAQVGPGMGSLSEELLRRVLSLVPLDCRGLLALRLVCRRWARAVLSPAVWRHRKLDLDKQPDGLGLLRLAPALDELCVHGQGNYKTEQMPILKALADSPCEFRSLRVFTSANPEACALMVRALERRRKSLRKLDLELVPYDADYKRYGFASVLAAVDAMESLEWLMLGYEDCGPDVGGEIEYSFQRLSSLRCLWLQEGLHRTTIRSLLAGNKQTLREVNCGENDVMQMIAEEVPSVRTVRAHSTGVSESIHHLQHLPDLELLDVESYNFELLARFLDRSPQVPKRVQLRLGFEKFCEWDARYKMPRVTTVRANLGGGLRPPRYTLRLRHVEVLQFSLYSASSNTWADLKAMWGRSTAPRLRELHLHDLSDEGLGRDAAWLAQLKAQRPQLKICGTSFALCPDAIW